MNLIYRFNVASLSNGVILCQFCSRFVTYWCDVSYNYFMYYSFFCTAKFFLLNAFFMNKLLGSRRKRRRGKSEKHWVHKRKESHDEEPEKNHLEVEYLKDFLGKKSKLKRTAKRRPKLIESSPLKNLTKLDENHIEKPKPEKNVGNITNNRREENEEILTLKLQELAIEIQEISAESADCKEANSENIEDYHTEFTRRQGDKLIARLGNFSNTLKQLCDLLQECK